MSLVQLPFLTLQVLLCLDPSPPWDIFSTLAHTLICYLTISSGGWKLDAGVGFLNYALGTNTAACAVEGFYLLLLAKPWRNFKYIGNENGDVHKVWWKKYFDILCIPYSPRLIGWSHQVKNIPPASYQPRRSFILRSTLRAVQHVILFEAGRLYVWYNPAYSSVAFGTQSYLAQFVNTAIFIGVSYWAHNAAYLAAAAGSVAIGWYHPRMWPDLFGAWGDAYTVRRFWGKTWHQMMRRFLAPLGRATSTALGFKRGTLGSSYTQLYVAFFLSGLIHTGGDIVFSSHSSAASQPFFSMPFFLFQAFIITLEDMLIWVARRLGVKNSVWTRVAGYVWVTAWFGWSVTKFVNDAFKAGGGVKESGADRITMNSNLVQATLGLLGFDVGAFSESWFSKA